jgi:hypothetical protein
MVNEKDDNPLPSCKNIFSITMGIPCAHKMKESYYNLEPLQLTDFHKQWYLETINFNEESNIVENIQGKTNISNLLKNLETKYTESAPSGQAMIKHNIELLTTNIIPISIDNIEKVITKGRPSTSTKRKYISESSTQRDLSQFEILEREVSYKCSHCKEFGHNKRKCP